jgi:hypothetical protein
MTLECGGKANSIAGMPGKILHATSVPLWILRRGKAPNPQVSKDHTPLTAVDPKSSRAEIQIFEFTGAASQNEEPERF